MGRDGSLVMHDLLDALAEDTVDVAADHHGDARSSLRGVR
jgi:hypothetical protein